MFAAPAAGALVACLVFAWPQSSDLWLEVAAAPVRIVLGLPYALLVVTGWSWCLGLPWHWLAQRFQWRSRPTYISAGLAMGAVSGLAISTLTQANIGSMTLFAGAIGGVTAWVAWLIRRPDRDAPNPTTPPP